MKLSISLPAKDVALIDRYVADEGAPSRSAVIRKAVDLLRHEQLVQQYKEAFREWRESGEAEIWDRAVGDGLDDERW